VQWVMKFQSQGFWEVPRAKPRKCIQNEVEKVWGQEELVLVEFGLNESCAKHLRVEL